MFENLRNPALLNSVDGILCIFFKICPYDVTFKTNTKYSFDYDGYVQSRALLFHNSLFIFGFGIWNFSNKLALALTAGILLPVMELAGFETQDMRSSLSREVLTMSYAIVPCGLKILALIWLQNLIIRDKNL